MTDATNSDLADEVLDETHDCGYELIRVDEAHPDNPYDGDAVACPSCLTLERVEGGDGER